MIEISVGVIQLSLLANLPDIVHCINIPSNNIGVDVFKPDVIQSCYVAVPDDGGTDPEPPASETAAIFTPIAPGVTYVNLPVEPEIYDDSPDRMIGCINNVADNPQGRLDALFPDAINGDGVIERFNNDIWVYNGTIWENVGPNPGPKMLVESVVPAENETALIESNIMLKHEFVSFDYSLTPVFTELDDLITNITIKAWNQLPPVEIDLNLPNASVNARGIPEAVSLSISSLLPGISTGVGVSVPSVFTANISGIIPADVGKASLIVFVANSSVTVDTPIPETQVPLSIKPPVAGINVAAPSPFFADYGQQIYASAGSYDFTVPDNVFSVSVVVVAGGGGSSGCPGGSAISGAGGGGGALAWVNNISVTPGETLTAIVGQGGAGGATTTSPGSTGGESALLRGATYLCHALGGEGGPRDGTRAEYGIPLVTDAAEFDGEGGYGGRGTENQGGGGGGGAGGYTGFGGNGGATNTGTGGNGTGGSGGGGGGQSTGGTPNNAGGGVGIFGEGANGIGGAPNNPGTGGSGGGTGRTGGLGGLYGGGGGGVEDDTSSIGFAGGGGAVRIIWGPGRVFPGASTAAIQVRKYIPNSIVLVAGAEPTITMV